MAEKKKRLIGKITLLADDLWIIRSVKISPNGKKDTRYYETPAIWNRAPTKSTIFTSYEAAEAHMRLLRERDLKDTKGYADESTEEFGIVPLHTEIIKGPNGSQIRV